MPHRSSPNAFDIASPCSSERDDISSLEIFDLDVYWTFMGQLRQQAKTLPAGNRITIASNLPDGAE